MIRSGWNSRANLSFKSAILPQVETLPDAIPWPHIHCNPPRNHHMIPVRGPLVKDIMTRPRNVIASGDVFIAFDGESRGQHDPPTFQMRPPTSWPRSATVAQQRGDHRQSEPQKLYFNAN